MLRRSAAGVAIVLLTLNGAAAQERATLAEAQTMAEAALNYLETEGPDVAFPAFTFGDEWHDRDLYVFALSLAGVSLAHGADPNLVGQNLIDLTDANGTPLIQEFVAVETTAWVNYIWPNPLTDEDEPKSSYIIRVGDVVVGVGAYLP